MRPVLAGALAGLAALAVYVATTSPWVGRGDAAEYQTLAATGGIAHSGYPSYVLALRAFGALPLATVAFRANLLSCLAGAASVALAAFAAARLARSTFLGVAAGLALAFSMTHWLDGTQACVHVFTLPLSAGVLLLALRFARAPGAACAAGLGLLFGLGLTAHLSVLGLVPAVGLAAGWAARAGRLRASHLAAAAGGALIGLLPFAYLVAQDRPGRPMNAIEDSIDPASGQFFAPGEAPRGRLERAAWLLEGRQFLAAGARAPWHDAGRKLARLALEIEVNEFPLLGLPLALAGLVVLARRRAREGPLLASWLIAVLALLAWAAFPNNYLCFALPVLWALAVLAAVALGAWRERSAPAATLAAVLLILAPWVRQGIPALPERVVRAHPTLGQVWSEWPEVWSPFRPVDGFERYGRALMRALPPRAVLLSSWSEGTIHRYVRFALGERPDVDVRLTAWQPRRVADEIAAARSAGRPLCTTFPPGLAGVDSARVRPAEGALAGYLWEVRAAGP